MMPRVLIRAHSARRDVAPLALFQKILERMRCSVMLTSGGSFTRALRFWKPHVAIVGTFGNAKNIKSVAPKTKIIVLDQEGIRNPKNRHAIQIMAQPELVANVDLGLFWGEKIIQEFEEIAPHLDRRNLHVVGYPKLDLVKYLPERFKTSKNNHSLGVVCRFPNINPYNAQVLIRTLPNPDNVEKNIAQIQAFVAMIKVLRVILERTDYKISIRPHPQEQSDSYKQYIRLWFGKEKEDRISIDESIDFAAWAAAQRVLLSPSSTSFLEAYILRVPVINLDAIATTFEYNRGYASVVAEWQEGCLLPKNMDELCEILEEEHSAFLPCISIEKQLESYCDGNSKESACLRAARLTKKLLVEHEHSFQLHWPKAFVDFLDGISFRRNMRKDSLHHNFNYRRGYHHIPPHFDEMADTILAESIVDRAT